MEHHLLTLIAGPSSGIDLGNLERRLDELSSIVENGLQEQADAIFLINTETDTSLRILEDRVVMI
jgi:hypothetical protein